jgi:putative membrane protein
MMKVATGKFSSLIDNPYANLLITMVFFASAFTSSKVVVGHMPHDAAAALRFLGGGIILAIVLAISKDHFVISPHNFMRCAISGSIGVFVYNLLFFQGVNLAPAIDGALIVPVLSPLFTFIILVSLKKETPTFAKVVGLSLGVVGAVIFVGNQGDVAASGNRFIGDLVFLAAAISWALYGIVSKNMLRNITPLQATTWSTIFGSIMLCAVSIPSFSKINWGAIPPVAECNLIFLAVGPTAIAYLFYYRGLGKVTPTTATLMMLSVPVFGAVFAFLFLGEIIVGWQIVGACLLLTGAFISLVSRKT